MAKNYILHKKSERYEIREYPAQTRTVFCKNSEAKYIKFPRLIFCCGHGRSTRFTSEHSSQQLFVGILSGPIRLWMGRVYSPAYFFGNATDYKVCLGDRLRFSNMDEAIQLFWQTEFDWVSQATLEQKRFQVDFISYLTFRHAFAN